MADSDEDWAMSSNDEEPTTKNDAIALDIKSIPAIGNLNWLGENKMSTFPSKPLYNSKPAQPGSIILGAKSNKNTSIEESKSSSSGDDMDDWDIEDDDDDSSTVSRSSNVDLPSTSTSSPFTPSKSSTSSSSLINPAISSFSTPPNLRSSLPKNSISQQQSPRAIPEKYSPGSSNIDSPTTKSSSSMINIPSLEAGIPVIMTLTTTNFAKPGSTLPLHSTDTLPSPSSKNNHSKETSDDDWDDLEPKQKKTSHSQKAPFSSIVDDDQFEIDHQEEEGSIYNSISTEVQDVALSISASTSKIKQITDQLVVLHLHSMMNKTAIGTSKQEYTRLNMETLLEKKKREIQHQRRVLTLLQQEHETLLQNLKYCNETRAEKLKIGFAFQHKDINNLLSSLLFLLPLMAVFVVLAIIDRM